MIDQTVLEAFNSRVQVNPNNIKEMKASQLDQIKGNGSEAESLLSNKQLALFIHITKFDLTDQLTNIVGHSQDDNNRRIAISNQLAGLTSFIDTLKRAVYYKNRVVTMQTTAAPTHNIKEVL